jgi:4-diphosphocytidyl-2-C-methyl-D-erythritol kinase
VVVAPQWLAVVKPPVDIPTKSIFDSPLLVRDTEPVILAGFPADTASVTGRNDLQPAAEAQAPAVRDVAKWLERFGNSRMTGSGSAVFARAGAIRNGTGDQPVATWREDELPSGWVGRMCRSLTQHPLAGWAD